MNLISLTKTLGWTTQQTTVYFQLCLEKKGISVLNLSRVTGIKRTTLYGVLNSLMEMGMVVKSLSETGSLFFAEPINVIEAEYQEKIEKMITEKNEIHKLSQRFTTDNTTHNSKFILHDKMNAANLIFRDILRSGEKKIYWFWPAKDMVKTISSDLFDYFHKERIERHIELDVLWPYTKKIDLREYPFLGFQDYFSSLRNIRILPKKIDQSAGYGIYGTKVAFISSSREHYGFIIDSRELAETMKSQFDFLWNMSKKMKS